MCRKSAADIAKSELSKLLRRDQSIEFTSLDDNKENHDRYLFSLRDALKYSKGFHVSMKFIEIETVSKTNHQKYVDLYIEGHHRFPIAEKFSVHADGHS